MPHSMTGFARIETQHPWGQLICEIRSVNHRYLEPSLRMPDGLRRLEAPLRETLRRGLSRGKVDANLFLKLEEGLTNAMAFNPQAAQKLIEMAQQINPMLAQPAPFSALDVLRWPGVLQTQELDQAAVDKAVFEIFGQAMQSLTANRQREGDELGQCIEQRLQAIAGLVVQLRERLPQLQEVQHSKLKTRLATLGVEVDQERLAQELVYLAQKSDVAEELDRLEAHLLEVRHTLKQREPVGRRLDFLMQELNREANTLSSKSTASETSQIAVDLKVLIEQMREQVQNIE